MLDPIQFCKDSSSNNNKAFESSYKPVSSIQSGSPKRTSTETTQNLYLSNYQTETVNLLATKREKTIMACSYLKFLTNLLDFKLLASNTAIMKVLI